MKAVSESPLAVARHAPITRQPLPAPGVGVAQHLLTLPGALVIAFHVAGANAAAPENVGIVRMLHMMDVANFLRFTHLAGRRRFPKILNIDTGPALMRHSRLRPFAGLPWRFHSSPILHLDFLPDDGAFDEVGEALRH